MKPALYLDVEGTLMLLGAGRPRFRPHLETLLEALAKRRDQLDCFWLTSYVEAQVRGIFRGLDTQGIAYQRWHGSKAGALRTGGPVLWVDDRCTDRDREVLAALPEAPHRVQYRSIARWDGDEQDRELLVLLEDIEAWLRRLDVGRCDRSDSCSRSA